MSYFRLAYEKKEEGHDLLLFILIGKSRLMIYVYVVMIYMKINQKY